MVSTEAENDHEQDLRSWMAVRLQAVDEGADVDNPKIEFDLMRGLPFESLAHIGLRTVPRFGFAYVHTASVQPPSSRIGRLGLVKWELGVEAPSFQRMNPRLSFTCL